MVKDKNDLLYTKEFKDITNNKLVCTIKRFEKNGFLFITKYGFRTFGNLFSRLEKDNDIDIHRSDVIESKLSSKSFLIFEKIDDEFL